VEIGTGRNKKWISKSHGDGKEEEARAERRVSMDQGIAKERARAKKEKIRAEPTEQKGGKSNQKREMSRKWNEVIIED